MNEPHRRLAGRDEQSAARSYAFLNYGGNLAGSSLSIPGDSSARATEQRLAGRRAASGARLKPDVSPTSLSLHPPTLTPPISRAMAYLSRRPSRALRNKQITFLQDQAQNLPNLHQEMVRAGL